MIVMIIIFAFYVLGSLLILFNTLKKIKKEKCKNYYSYKLLLNSSFWINMNANDFFMYACADAVVIDESDLEWIIPIIDKYEEDGIWAIMSFIRKQEPLEYYRTNKYKKAKEEIENLKLEEIWSLEHN